MTDSTRCHPSSWPTRTRSWPDCRWPAAPVFYAPSIGYYVITRYADIEQVFRDSGSYSAAVAQAPLVPAGTRGPADPAGRRAPAAAVHGQPGRARARPAAQARGPRVQHDAGQRHGPDDRGDHGPAAGRGGRAAGVRSGRRAGVPAAGQHRLLADGRARAGLRAAQALVRLPGRAGLGPPGARRPGRDRHQHGRLPRLPARPGRHQGPRARRRPDQRPAGHPRRGPGAAHPGRDLLDPVLAVVRRARDHHRPDRQHGPPAAGGPGPLGRASWPDRD